jgi:signal transduction histidine kinase
VLLVADHGGLAATALDLQRALGVVLTLAAVVLAVRRWRSAEGLERRGVAPLVGTAAVLLTLGILSAAAQDLGAHRDLQRVAQLVFIASFLGLPVAFAAGLVRGRFFRTALGTRLIEGLSDGDDGAALAHWLPEQGAYVDRDGRPFPLPEAGGDRVAVEVTDGGRRVGVLVHDAALAGDPALLGAATGAAALRLANDRLEVELRARLEALRRSRARIVQAGDDERRRLGRDLHDGAQQRLVSVLIELQLAEDRFAAAPEQAREHVGRALADARAAVGELRDLAAGIHPAVLSQRGLGAALDTLAARSRVPAELRVDLEGRLPLPLETAAYFVVAEALTNVAKHAEATHVRIAVRRAGGDVVVEVADDGRGGADPAGGSGLRGLGDRVGAVDGTLEVRSTAGGGTIVRVRMPCAS